MKPKPVHYLVGSSRAACGIYLSCLDDRTVFTTHTTCRDCNVKLAGRTSKKGAA